METRLDELVLTESQSACLEYLKRENGSKNEIALYNKLNLKRTSNALTKLKQLGLVRLLDANP